ncbi:MAG: DUF4278 domain-containing protein [Synechococcales bacterium]|nr:DUF4278 domain-containing protein [Synechococcales bacterium]
MKLSYRGVQYEYSPPSLEVTEGEVRGAYRGVPWRCHTVVVAPQPATPQDSAGSPSTPVTPSIQSWGVGHTEASLVDYVLPSLLPQVHRLHLANLERNIAHRLEVAQQRGDRTLVSQLEEEFEQVLCRQ